jgi:hypothetical protein
MTSKKPKQLIHHLTFSRSTSALFDYLSGRTRIAVEAIEIFYNPIALMEAKAPVEEVDKALDRSLALIKAQAEILQRSRDRYVVDVPSSPSPMKTEVATANPKKLVPDDEEDDGTINILGGFNK